MARVTENYNGHTISYEKSEEYAAKGNTACGHIDTAKTQLSSIDTFISTGKDTIPKTDNGYDALATAVIEGLDKLSSDAQSSSNACDAIKTNITSVCKELDEKKTRENRQAAIDSIPKDKGEGE